MGKTTSNDPNVITQEVVAANGQASDIVQYKKYDGTVIWKVNKDGFVSEPQGMTGLAASYIIFKVGSIYYAKNGRTGAIDYSGASPAPVIQSCLTAMTGGLLLIKNGTYTSPTVTGEAVIVANAGIAIEGEGWGTILDGIGIVITAAYSRVANIKIIGNCPYDIDTGGACVVVKSPAHNTIVENVFSSANNSVAYGMENFNVYSGTTVSDELRNVIIKDCVVEDSYAIGFHIGGHGTVKNIWFVNCVAKNCGLASQRNEWVCGFDLGEGPFLEQDVFVVNCIAEGSWEAGFHIENSPSVENMHLINCVSRNNGQKGATASYGYGFMVKSGMRLSGCRSYGNEKFGYRLLVNTSENIYMNDCKDDGSHGGIIMVGSYSAGGSMYLDNCESLNSTFVGIEVSAGKNIFTRNLRSINAAGEPAGTVGPYINRLSGTTDYESKDCIFDIDFRQPASAPARTVCMLNGSPENVIITGFMSNLQAAKGTWFYLGVPVRCQIRDMTIEAIGDSQIVCGFTGNAGGVYVSNTMIYDPQASPTMVLPITGNIAGNAWPLIETDTVKARNLLSGSPFYNVKFTKNGGTTTIVAGDTYVDVTHLIHGTPASQGIKVEPTTYLNGRSFKVDTIGASTFRINISTADTVVHTFKWEAIINSLGGSI